MWKFITRVVNKFFKPEKRAQSNPFEQIPRMKPLINEYFRQKGIPVPDFATDIAYHDLEKFPNAETAWKVRVKPLFDTKFDFFQEQTNRMESLVTEYFKQRGQPIPDYARQMARIGLSLYEFNADFAWNGLVKLQFDDMPDKEQFDNMEDLMNRTMDHIFGPK